MILTLRAPIPPDAEVEIEVGDDVHLGQGEAGTVVSVRVSGRTMILEVEVPDDHPLARALQDTQLRVSLGPSPSSTSTWNPSGAKRRLGR
jgi:hypothetical protein